MKKLFVFALSATLFAGFCGCASTVPTADSKKPIAAADRLCSNDEIMVELTAAEGVSLNEISGQRLGSLLEPVLAESAAHAIVTETSQGRDQSSANQQERDAGL